MEGFIYELASSAGQALMRPWLLVIAGIAVIAVLSGAAGRIVIAVENRLAAPPPRRTDIRLGSSDPTRGE
ncbi:MAG: hypothetical protein QNJ88_01980 [Acidimicrobiia bacterium]|nr:hypothetical protein [Acidimicrobiia bacterium]